MKNLPRPTAVSLLKPPAIVLSTVILFFLISPFPAAADSPASWEEFKKEKMERTEREKESIKEFVRQFIKSAHDLDMEKLTEMTKPIEGWLARDWPSGSGRAFSKVYFEGWGRFPLVEIEKIDFMKYDNSFAICTLAFQVGQEIARYYFQVERVGERFFVHERGHFWPILPNDTGVFFDVCQRPNEQGVVKHLLLIETKNEYPNLNFSIRLSFSLSGNTLIIEIFDIYEPPIGPTAIGPAHGKREVHLADGDYKLVFKRDEMVDNYDLKVSGDKISIDGVGNTRFTQRKVGLSE